MKCIPRESIDLKLKTCGLSAWMTVKKIVKKVIHEVAMNNEHP